MDSTLSNPHSFVIGFERDAISITSLKLFAFNPIKQTVIFDTHSPQNDWHDQNFAVKPVAHNLLHAFYRLIESLDCFIK